MLSKFLAPGDWFPPKRYGYGAGLPFVWQGWALLLSYLLALAGTFRLAASPHPPARATIVLLVLILTATMLEICRRRTRGGWRWRWGED